jgi:AcrR family transcriptional regulator
MSLSKPPQRVPQGLWENVQPAASRRLLLAALELFAARGYAATTTREIARRAGISPAGVYIHYQSKDQLLYEISRKGHVMVLHEVERALQGEADPTKSVRRFVSTFTGGHARHHTLARVIQYELHALKPDHFAEVRALRRRFEDLMRTLIRRGADSGDFSVQQVDIAATAILSLGIDVARWYSPRSISAEDLGAQYADIALRILGAAPSSQAANRTTKSATHAGLATPSTSTVTRTIA